MNLKDMTTAELEARASAILEEIDKDGADLKALKDEAKAIREELDSRAAAEAARAEARAAVAGGAGRILNGMAANQNNQRASEEDLYRSAFLKNLATTRDGIHLLGEMTTEERDAFIHTTANTGNVVPAVMMNRIIDLVESMAPMLDDATRTNMTQGFGIPRRTAISQGDATGVTEGTANDDEENTFGLLSMDGIEIKKHVVITRKMKFKSIDAFESWVIDEIGKRIAVAKEAVIRARLDGSAPSGGSEISGSGIAAANILTSQSYTDAAIRGMFAKVKGAGERVIYANSATIWSYLFGIVDSAGNKIFVPNSMVDPLTAGRIYGATVKVDDNLSNNVVYLIVKGAVLANDYDDFFLFRATEPKTVNEIITGYSLFDAGLEMPTNAVKATFTP